MTFYQLYNFQGCNQLLALFILDTGKQAGDKNSTRPLVIMSEI